MPARTGPLLKLFEGETNTRLLVLLDTSASMGLGGGAGRGRRSSEPAKLRYAVWLAAALVHIAGRQHDAVGLATFDEDVRFHLPPRPGPAHREALYRRLAAASPSGGSACTAALDHAARRMVRRGVVAVISDFYCDPADFGRALRVLGARGHDLMVFHVLGSGERRPVALTGRLGRNTTLRDVETGTVMEVEAAELKTAYPRRLAGHQEALGRQAGAAGAHYVRMNADEPLDRGLVRYLRFRNRRP